MCGAALNGLPEVNRLLTFNLALTFLEVSGRYVKEQLRLSEHLAGSVKGAGGGDRLGGPEGWLGGSQQDTKEPVGLGEGLAPPPRPRRLGGQEVWVVLRPQPRALVELQDLRL